MDLVFDHFGIVVADLVSAKQHLAASLGITQWGDMFHDAGIGVSVQFGASAASPCFELICPLGEDSPVKRALAQGKNILNHVAYLAEDLEKAAEHLRQTGCFPIGEAQPAVAYGGKRVQFFLSPLRFIIEIVEAPGHRHELK